MMDRNQKRVSGVSMKLMDLEDLCRIDVLFKAQADKENIKLNCSSTQATGRS